MRNYINGQSIAFGPDEIFILVAAFDEAWQSALANLSNQQDGGPERTRKILADRIIWLAAQGERDQARLSKEALDYLALTLAKEDPAPPAL